MTSPTEFWVYENTVHRKARVHRADCSFCSDGHGLHGGGQTVSGKWFGPFPDLASAMVTARNTRQDDIRACGVCMEPLDAPPNSPSAPAHQPKPVTEIVELGPWEWDQREELMCALRLNWIPKGRLVLDAQDKVQFPNAPAIGVFTDSRRDIPMDDLRFTSAKAKI